MTTALMERQTTADLVIQDLYLESQSSSNNAKAAVSPITTPGWEQQVMFVVVAELGPGCWCTADSDAA